MDKAAGSDWLVVPHNGLLSAAEHSSSCSCICRATDRMSRGGSSPSPWAVINVSCQIPRGVDPTAKIAALRFSGLNGSRKQELYFCTCSLQNTFAQPRPKQLRIRAATLALDKATTQLQSGRDRQVEGCAQAGSGKRMPQAPPSDAHHRSAPAAAKSAAVLSALGIASAILFAASVTTSTQERPPTANR